MNRQQALRLPNYVKRFGPVAGLRLGRRIGAARGGASEVAQPTAVPGFDRPVYLRPTISDHSIFWQCIVRAQYDLSRYPQMAEIVRRATTMRNEDAVPVIVDGGANIGLATLGFAQDFPEAHVVAVEPDGDNMRVVRQNVGPLGDRVIAVQAAVASVSGHSRVIGFDRGSAGLMTENCVADAEGAVPAWSIDDLIAMVPGGRPWIVKLDIEGAQREVFSANTEWVGRTDLIILELDDWQFPWAATGDAFFKALSRYKFDFVVDGELILAFRHI
jgi:FkbM family methyltransferase